jgi:hypothetical protein
VRLAVIALRNPQASSLYAMRLEQGRFGSKGPAYRARIVSKLALAHVLKVHDADDADAKGYAS